MKKLLLLFITLAISSLCMGYDVEINLNLANPSPFNLFYASSVDPDNPLLQPILFRGDISITNDGPDQLDDYYLEVELRWEDRTLINDSKVTAIQPLIKGIPKTFTSRDVISNIPTNGFEGELTMDGVLDENPDFKDVIMETGRFPDGHYHVLVEVFNADGVSVSNIAPLDFTIVNPLNIQLLYPGGPAGQSIVSYPTQRPTFMWISNLQNFEIKIVEVDNPSTFSAEMIDGSTPVCEETTRSTAFRYPTSAPMLEIGRAYAWQVKGEVLTAGGANNHWLESPVFTFRIENPNNDPVQLEILYTLLNNILDVPGMEDFLDLLNLGYSPTGNVLYHGEIVPFSQLNDLISDILSGEITVKSIIVE